MPNARGAPEIPSGGGQDILLPVRDSGESGTNAIVAGSPGSIAEITTIWLFLGLTSDVSDDFVVLFRTPEAQQQFDLGALHDRDRANPPDGG